MSSLENTIQDAVNSVTGGVFNTIVKALLCLVVTFLLFGAYVYFQFHGLKEPAGMEYAQLARNMAEGRGYITSCIRPVDMWYLTAEHGRNLTAAACQDIRNPPFFPAVISLGFKVVNPSFDLKPGDSLFEPEINVIVPLCILFTIITGFFIYLSGVKLFGRRVAVVATLAFLVSKSVLDDSISGLPVSLVTMLASAAICAALSFREAYDRNKPVSVMVMLFLITAILCSAAFLTSYKTAVFIPVVASFMVSGFLRRNWLTAGAFILVVCIMVSPWLIRNLKVSGGIAGIAPYTALYETAIYKGDSFDRQSAPVLDNARIARSIKMKFMAGFSGICDVSIRMLGNGLIMCLFLAAVFYKFEREDVNHLKWSIVVMLMLAAAAGAVFSADQQSVFKPFLPFVTLYAVAFFFSVLDRDEFADDSWKIIMTGVLILLTALPAIFAVSGRNVRMPYPPYFPPFIAYVSGLLAPAENICTDIPWATAWYGRRTSVLLPQSVDEFRRVNDGYVRMSGLYLTTATGDMPYNSMLVQGGLQSWLPVLNGNVPKDFPLTHGISLPEGRRDQIFLTDRDRWAKGGPDASAKSAGDK